ncbi:hypothetical protein V1477_016172 [Vespula maculifrons]|uniref:Uncharacterized protein n=1 Tax=Vespula maculifrons TaxID=7453 RepID=A0ABD2BC96_VESMC
MRKEVLKGTRQNAFPLTFPETRTGVLPITFQTKFLRKYDYAGRSQENEEICEEDEEMGKRDGEESTMIREERV